MRKSSPFVAIPTLPSTISGQWLTFSHMANHYRKLLNVKPRVETFAPKNQQSLAPAPAPKSSKPKKTIRKRVSTKSKEESFLNDGNVPPPRTASNIIDFEYQLLSKAMDKEKPSKTKMITTQKIKKSCLSQNNQDAYKQMLEESLANNISDDVLSDSELDDHLHLQMGVSEKIRLYLDQIQHSESSTSNPHTPTPRQRYSLGTTAKAKVAKSQEPVVEDAYHARHSNCFVPYVSTPRDSPRNSRIKASVTKTSNIKMYPKQASRSENCIPSKKPKPLLLEKAKYAQIPKVTTPKLKKNTRCKNMDELLQAGLKKVKVKATVPNRSFSPASGSIGTVRGSDELIEEQLAPLLSPTFAAHLRSGRRESEKSKKLKRTTELVENQQISSEWLKDKTEKGIVRINNAYFQVGSNFSKSSLSTLGLINNKDSSRDSAYGFSSGESRITTRESTPEKIGSSSRQQRGTRNKASPETRTITGKYKSSLSTVASSINQDNPSAQAYLPYLDESTNLSRERGRTSSGSNWLSETKYINFLTAVTNDIVTRGIYTNKGLKSLFHAHVNKNKDLEMDKMTYMLDRLRMDVGIPKDDSLNNLEFGYGSVKYSKGPFFFKSEGSEQCVSGKDKKTTFKTNDRERELSASKSRASDLTILELHRQDFHSGDESSKMSSCTTSVINGHPGGGRQGGFDDRHDLHNMSGVSSESSKSSGELSLTESEIRNALFEVGFDAETALDIVQIVNSSSHKKHGEPNNNKVERRNYSSAFVSETNIANPRSTGSFESLQFST